MLKTALEDDIEEEEVINEEDEEAPNSLVRIPQSLFAVNESNHYNNIIS